MESIKFTKDKKSVENFLLPLNNIPDFIVEQIDSNIFKVTYYGGYNNVYDHTCTITIIKMKNIHDMWFNWIFSVESELHSIIIDVCESGWNLGFMDFFVDEYIRDIGNILNIQEYD